MNVNVLCERYIVFDLKTVLKPKGFNYTCYIPLLTQHTEDGHFVRNMKCYIFFFVNATDNGDLVEIILNLLTETMMLRQVRQLCGN